MEDIRCFDNPKHAETGRIHTRCSTGNKVSDKVVAVVCRGFKTDDDAVASAEKLHKAGL